MSNQIYKDMMGQQPNMMQALQNLKQNPIQFIAQRRFNVPQEIANNPNAIISHLMNTGQISQQKYDKVMQMLSGQMKQNAKLGVRGFYRNKLLLAAEIGSY